MSTLPDNEFDLEKLFLPAWAQEEPSASKYAKYEGEPKQDDRRDYRRGPRPPRREGPAGRRGERPGAPRGERRGPPTGERGPGRRGERPGAPRGEGRELREQRPPPPPLPEINLSLLPEEKGVESLTRQIRMAGRAYPLFDIAQMILQKPERHDVVFSVKKNAEGQVIQPLFLCALDDTLWLSEDEAVGHVLKKHFATFYQAERTATEPPKGKYTFVAQCGLSGVVLGPPNHHDYQNQLRKLHAERFSRMPFETYKARVRIVRDEEVVKKWIDDQSWKTEYLCLNLPEPLRLDTMEKVEQHFRETHKENIIKPVESHKLGGVAARALRSLELSRLIRSVWEDQRRFPLQIATTLSQQFASHGLQFFKVNRTVTHVSVARPHYLDMAATPVSEGVKRIVDYINANPKCNRRKLVEALAPSPAAPPAVAAAPEGAPAAPPAEPGPTPEQTAVISDLHWLIHQGHVIEFANGILDTAKKPLPKPPRPEPKAAAQSPAEPPAQPGPETGAAPAEAQPEPPAQTEAQTGIAPEPATAAATTQPTAGSETPAPPQTPAAPTPAGTEPTDTAAQPAEPPPTPANLIAPGTAEERPSN
jgi:hypothetical protein